MTSKNTMGRRTVIAGAAGLVAAAAVPSIARAEDVGIKQPSIDYTDAWGARAPTGTPTTISGSPQFIVVHHAVTANTTDYSIAQAYRHARQVQDIHQGQNWIDTGYNFVISRGGFITEGRHGSLDALYGGNSFIQGAHASGVNTVSIGFCLEGNYEAASSVPGAQWWALGALVDYARSQYGISGQVYGHRDHGSTACPGTAVYNRLGEL